MLVRAGQLQHPRRKTTDECSGYLEDATPLEVGRVHSGIAVAIVVEGSSLWRPAGALGFVSGRPNGAISERHFLMAVRQSRTKLTYPPGERREGARVL